MKKRQSFTLSSLSAALALSIFAASPTPTIAQDWEVVDTVPGGAHGNTIIQLPDGSILNTFRIELDGDYNKDNEWVTRWKPDDAGASWQTIDHWMRGGDLLEATPYSAASYLNEADDTIEVYVVGKAYVNDLVTTGKGRRQTTENYEVSRWVVRRGIYDKSGDTWSWVTVRMFGNESGDVQESYDARDVAIDSNGVVYVTGKSNDDWLTEVSYDGGNTWVESDFWRLDSGAHSYGKGLAAGADGSVFAVGFASEEIPGSGKGKNRTPSTFVWHWITRKLDPNSQTWSEVDDYVGFNQAYANDVIITSDGILLVCGKSEPEYAGNPGGDGHWIVRASANNGATWATVDDYKPLEGTHVAFIPYSMSEAPDGTVFVAGMYDLDPESSVPGTHTIGIRSSSDLVNWSLQDLLPQEWLDRQGSTKILAAESIMEGGSYLYSSAIGPNPDGALIRIPIPYQN